MSDEVLDAVIHAYREEHSGASLDVRAVRRRLVAKLLVRQRRRATRLRFVVPLAATFFGSVALAGTQRSLPGLERVREWLGVTAGDARPAPGPDERAPRVIAATRAPAAPPIAAPASAPEKVSLEDLPLGPPAPAPAHSAPDALRPDLARYAAAHRLHFHGGDPARALEAWSAYLAHHPGGVFVPEARFNRASCLLRLGRRSEARAVLRDIERAGGSYAERAREVIEALEPDGE